jgi:hypothetical protein
MNPQGKSEQLPAWLSDLFFEPRTIIADGFTDGSRCLLAMCRDLGIAGGCQQPRLTYPAYVPRSKVPSGQLSQHGRNSSLLRPSVFQV